MQVFVDSIKAKQARGEPLDLAEIELLYLRDRVLAIDEKIDQIASGQREIVEMFQQGTGALKLFKITSAIIAPILGLYAIWKIFTGEGAA